MSGDFCSAVFRNLYATHALGDMIGLRMMLVAICKEIGIKSGNILIHALHWELDEKDKLKKIIMRIED